MRKSRVRALKATLATGRTLRQAKRAYMAKRAGLSFATDVSRKRIAIPRLRA